MVIIIRSTKLESCQNGFLCDRNRQTDKPTNTPVVACWVHRMWSLHKRSSGSCFSINHYRDADWVREQKHDRIESKYKRNVKPWRVIGAVKVSRPQWVPAGKPVHKWWCWSNQGVKKKNNYKQQLQKETKANKFQPYKFPMKATSKKKLIIIIPTT